MEEQLPESSPHPRIVRPLMGKRDLHLLEGTALAIFVALIVGAFLISSFGGFMVRSNQAAAVVTAVLIDLTNQNRTQSGLPELQVSPILTEAAQEKADDEASKGYFAHVSPTGQDPWYWFQQAGYNFTYAGENLAVNFTDSQAVVNAWMNSPEHRANILNDNYTQIGIATAQGMYQGQGTIFVVQEFAAPAAAPTQAPVQEEVVPVQPTKVAVATTQATSATPEILGQTSDNTSGPPEESPNTASPIAAVTPVSALVAGTTSIRSGEQAALAHPEVIPATWAFLASSPETTLQYAYYLIGLVVLLALAITTELEFKMHHMRKFAVAGSLFALMICLFFVANTIVFSSPTIAQTQNIVQEAAA